MPHCPANREAFVTSCIDMFIKGNVAAGISAAGVFDGIDVDWEYPGSCGATCAFRPEDKQNFVALLAEFRRQLDLLGQAKGRSTCSPSPRRPAVSSTRSWIFPASCRPSIGSTS
jgi:chitinase